MRPLHGRCGSVSGYRRAWPEQTRRRRPSPVVGLASVAAYLVVVLQRIGYPYELTYFEGSTVEVAGRVAAGQPLYGPPTTEYTPWPYPPLYFWLTGALAKVTGVDLTTMRVVSVAASLAVLVLLALIVRRAGGSTVAGIVAAGLYAATYRVSGAFADTARVDSLLLALLLAAVFVGMRARTWRGGIGLGAMLLLAFLTKQNALLVAAPMLLWLLVRRRGVGVGATATLGVGVVASTLVGNLLTDGWYAAVRRGAAAHPVVVPSLALGVLVRGPARAVRRVRGRRGGGVRGPTGPPGVGSEGESGRVARGLRLPRRLRGGDARRVVGRPAPRGRLRERLDAGSGRGRRSAGPVAGPVVAVRVRDGDGRVGRGGPAGRPGRHDVVGAPRRRSVAAGSGRRGPLHRDPSPAPGHGAGADPSVLPTAGRPSHPRLGDRDLRPVAREGRSRVPLRGAAVEPRGVSAVVLDNATDVGLFGDALTRDFTLVTSTVVPDGVFLPETDLPTHPALLYVRTTALLAGDGSGQLSAATSPSKR